MPNWKKVIVSGSNAELNHITASGNISGSLTGSFAHLKATVIEGNSPLNIRGVSELTFDSSATLELGASQNTNLYGNPVFHGDINIFSGSAMLDEIDQVIFRSTNTTIPADGYLQLGDSSTPTELNGDGITLKDDTTIIGSNSLAGSYGFNVTNTSGNNTFVIGNDGNIGVNTTPSSTYTFYIDDGATTSNTLFVNSYNRIGWNGGARQWIEGWSARIAFKGGQEGEFARFSGAGGVNRLNVARAIHLSSAGGDTGDTRFTRLDTGTVAIGNSADDASGTLYVGNLGVGNVTGSLTHALEVTGNISASGELIGTINGGTF